MSKRTIYWLGGLIAACLILSIVWFTVFGNSQNHTTEHNMNNNPAPAHENMNHGQMNVNQTQARQDLTNYLNEEKNIMMDMMKGMENIIHSGNASIDFLAGMIPHHESAIVMADSYLKYSAADGELKRIAEEIKAAQTGEIQQMKSMIQSIKSAGTKDEEAEAAYLEQYNAMLTQHHAPHSPANSVDEAFANGMIMHHQMAVDMSESILEYTDQEDVKNLAQTIIATQKQEIAEMTQILTRLKSQENTTAPA